MKNQTSDRPRWNQLHPAVYKVIIGFALWTLLAAWSFAGPAGYTAYILAVVTGFIVMAVTLPTMMWRGQRENRGPQREQAPAESRPSFHDWAAGEIDISRGRLKGWDAAIEALLPAGAVALGMTAFAVILHFTVKGG